MKNAASYKLEFTAHGILFKKYLILDYYILKHVLLWKMFFLRLIVQMCAHALQNTQFYRIQGLGQAPPPPPPDNFRMANLTPTNYI